MKKKIAKWILFIAAIVIVKFIGTGLRILESIVEGQHGAPAFVTTGFQVFATISLILFILAYYLLGRYIPIKNKIVRGVVFSVLFLATDYLPQILGMAGGVSTFISSDALNLPTILIDSVGYLLNGVVLGYFITPKTLVEKKDINIKKVFISCIFSMLFFPIVLGIFEFFAGNINSNMYCINSFGITPETYISFYIIFYLFQAVSGLMMVIFYRFSEYNRLNSSWLRFASVFGILLWLPIVLIVMFFGVNPIITILWGIMMTAVIYLDIWLFSKIMKSA